MWRLPYESLFVKRWPTVGAPVPAPFRCWTDTNSTVAPRAGSHSNHARRRAEDERWVESRAQRTRHEEAPLGSAPGKPVILVKRNSELGSSRYQPCTRVRSAGTY